MRADLIQVLGFEFRRHMRSPRFWRLLLLGGALGMLITMALLGLIVFAGETTLSPQRTVFVSLVLWSGMWGGLLLLAAPLLARTVSEHRSKTGVIPDLYLTSLHPLGIGLGRLAAVGLLLGLVMLMLTPASLAVCLAGGVALRYWLLHLGLSWLATLLLTSLGMRFLSRPPESQSSLPTEIEQLSAVSWLIGFLPAAFLIGAPILFREWRLPLPYLLFSPLLIPYGMVLSYPLGSWELPLWLVALPQMIGFILLGSLATAQRIGWWCEDTYRLQRWGGSFFYLLVFLSNLYPVARLVVHSVAGAERLLFWSTLAGFGLYLGLGPPLLGYHSVARRPQPLRFACIPPLGGYLWEWALLAGIGMAAWGVIGFTSGYWVEPSRWGTWLGYFWSLLLLLQSGSARALLPYLFIPMTRPPFGRWCFYHANTTDSRLYLEQMGSRRLALFSLFLAAHFILSVTLLIPHSWPPWWQRLADILRTINPASGLTPTLPLSQYWFYTALSLGLALWVFRRAYWQARREWG